MDENAEYGEGYVVAAGGLSVRKSQKKYNRRLPKSAARLLGGVLAAAILCGAAPLALAEGEPAQVTGEAENAAVFGMAAQSGTTGVAGFHGAKGDTFNYTVTFSKLAFRESVEGTPQVTGAQFTLAYDASLLNYESVSFFAAGSSNSGKQVNPNAEALTDDTDGLSHINLVWWDLDKPYTGDGTAFCTVTFTAKEDFTRASVTLEQLKLAAGGMAAGTNVAAVNAGTIKATLQNPSATILYGDVNGDGELGVADVSTLQSYLIGSVKEDAIDLAAADTNGDGELGVSDVSTLQTYLIVEDKPTLGPQG